ncbi:MAG TPA: response regulator [Kofleriaceae bacterium]|nr:response regulator [Kofleriaceae bacterium]
MKRPPHLDIIVIEDDPDLREPLCELLCSWGHRVRSAATGAAALALLAEGAVAVPAVALIDIGLPDMTGYALACEIRLRCASPPWLIALTGFTDLDDDPRARAAGFDLHLRKPPDLAHLREVLAGLGT